MQQQQRGEGAQAPFSSADPTAAQKQQQKKKKKRKRNHDHPDLLAAVLGLKADDKSAMWEAYQRLRLQEFDLDAHFCLMVVTGLLGVFPQQRHVVSKTQHMCRLEDTAADWTRLCATSHTSAPRHCFVPKAMQSEQSVHSPSAQLQVLGSFCAPQCRFWWCRADQLARAAARGWAAFWQRRRACRCCQWH